VSFQLPVPLPLETQIHYASEFFQDLVSVYQRRRFPKAIFEEAKRFWRTSAGPVSIDNCWDGINFLAKVGKIRMIEETSEIEITEKFEVSPKVRMEIDFDREISNQFQAELKKLEEAHGLLYQLENNLRKFIVVTLSSVESNWMDTLIDESVRKKWESRKKEEESCDWLRPVGHELIYYSDLIDLRQIINRNWEPIFSKKLDWKHREVLVSRMVELELIRHIIAHNRQISDEALKHLKILCDDFSNILI